MQKDDDLANRVIAMIESECALLDFLYDHPNCIRDEFVNAEEECAYEKLKFDHDNDFCRVREWLREAKNDPSLWEC